MVGSGLEFAKNLTVPLKKLEVWWNFPSLIRRGMFGEKGRNKLFWNLREREAKNIKKSSRKPAVVPATLEEDLSRRDFTVNAMAMKVESAAVLPLRRGGARRAEGSDVVIDPYNGQKDLENKNTAHAA